MASTDPTVAILQSTSALLPRLTKMFFLLRIMNDGGDNLSKGSFLIKATLKEMEEIKQLGIDLNKTRTSFLIRGSNLKRQYSFTAHIRLLMCQ
jgi:hypothetical protein